MAHAIELSRDVQNVKAFALHSYISALTNGAGWEMLRERVEGERVRERERDRETEREREREREREGWRVGRDRLTDRQSDRQSERE